MNRIGKRQRARQGKRCRAKRERLFGYAIKPLEFPNTPQIVRMIHQVRKAFSSERWKNINSQLDRFIADQNEE